MEIESEVGAKSIAKVELESEMQGIMEAKTKATAEVEDKAGTNAEANTQKKK